MKTNWPTKKLGEVCEIVNGGTPKTNIKKYWDGDILWITPKDMGKLESIHVSDTARKISNEGLQNSSAKIIPPNSIILSSRAPIGYLAINKKAITTNQGCKGIVPQKELSVYFLFYFLKHSVDLLEKLGSGTTFKELSSTKLSEVQIPLPPLPTQHRIVKILDEVFENIAKAKENTKKNLQNAKELFDAYLNNIFANSGKNWEYQRLADVLQKTETVNPLHNPDKEFVYIDVSSVNKETLSIENVTSLTGKNAPSRARKLIKTDDVIFATIRPTLRRIAVVPEKFNQQICSTGYFVLRTKQNLINKLVFYFLQTRSFNDKMKKLQKGASYPAVTDGEVKDQVISYPEPLPVQKSIVARLDTLSAETKKLEAIYRQKLADLEELKKSVLRKAFSGELK